MSEVHANISRYKANTLKHYKQGLIPENSILKLKAISGRPFVTWAFFTIFNFLVSILVSLKWQWLMLKLLFPEVKTYYLKQVVLKLPGSKSIYTYTHLYYNIYLSTWLPTYLLNHWALCWKQILEYFMRGTSMILFICCLWIIHSIATALPTNGIFWSFMVL